MPDTRREASNRQDDNITSLLQLSDSCKLAPRGITLASAHVEVHEIIEEAQLMYHLRIHSGHRPDRTQSELIRPKMNSLQYNKWNVLM